MFVYIHNGLMAIAERTGGAVFCDTTSGYGIQRDGASCFDIGASEPIFKAKHLDIRTTACFLISSLAFFSQNNLSFSWHGDSKLASSC